MLHDLTMSMKNDMSIGIMLGSVTVTTGFLTGWKLFLLVQKIALSGF